MEECYKKYNRAGKYFSDAHNQESHRIVRNTCGKFGILLKHNYNVIKL